MSRATKAYASAYQPGRVHESSIVRGESRLFECDFNGALGGETIVSATWSNSDPAAVTLSGIAQASGVVSVSALAIDGGCPTFVCEATTSAGRVLSQRFDSEIHDPQTTGAATLTWTA